MNKFLVKFTAHYDKGNRIISVKEGRYTCQSNVKNLDNRHDQVKEKIKSELESKGRIVLKVIIDSIDEVN